MSPNAPGRPNKPPQHPPLKISTPNISDEAISGVLEVLRSRSLVQGEQALAFEQALSERLGVPYVALVSSGTAALHLALLALELPQGSGVVVPNFTFPATLNAVLLAGLTPILADVCPGRYVVTSRSVSEAIKEAERVGVEVRALMPVHEFGQPVDADDLTQLTHNTNIKLIEDAACALGARYRVKGVWREVGWLGDAACFSFHPRKTLTTGEGGAVVTHSREVYERVCELRSHGMRREGGSVSFVRAGFNYRLTDFQAALGRAQLPQLSDWVERRRELAARYHELLAPLHPQGLGLPPLVEGHSWQTFMVTLPEGVDRGVVMEALREAGVESNIGAQTLSRQAYLAPLLERGEVMAAPSLSASEALAERGLALPLCEQYGEEELERVSVSLKESLDQR